MQLSLVLVISERGSKMTELKRRKDSKNRVLKQNESQRKDGTYQYRWRDKLGNRYTIYAKTLQEAIRSIEPKANVVIFPLFFIIIVVPHTGRKAYIGIHDAASKTTPKKLLEL